MTQCDAILKYLRSGRSLTTYQAYDFFNVTRLPDRIRDLRKRGVSVYAEMITVASGKRCARYTL